MNYKPEELLALVSKLSEKYTSKESSSITYDTARMLMEAVVYCIEDGLGTNGSKLAGRELPNCEIVYQQGYEAIVEKTCKAREVYERIIAKFEDYGCQNYKETIIDGIPQFFLHYDAKFAPQDHILTLDYPMLLMEYDKCGIRLILEYLKGIEQEQDFLCAFSPEEVSGLLERIMPEYRATYMGNICEPVLLNTIGCVIAEQPVNHLNLRADDHQEIKEYFRNDSREKIQQKISAIISLILKKLHKADSTGYFQRAADGYALRIQIGLENDSLEAVFGDCVKNGNIL